MEWCVSPVLSWITYELAGRYRVRQHMSRPGSVLAIGYDIASKDPIIVPELRHIVRHCTIREDPSFTPTFRYVVVLVLGQNKQLELASGIVIRCKLPKREAGR